MDVVYDHFLATDEELFTDESLRLFTEEVYSMLSRSLKIFPEKFSGMFPYMQSQNWLYNYRFRWGIEKSFGSLVRRAAYIEESDTAFALFNENYELLKIYSRDFIHSVIPYARNYCLQLLKE